MERIIDALDRFYSGQLGRWQLKEKYVRGWRWVSVSITVALLLTLLIVLMEWWCGNVVPFLNYVIWG